MTVIYEHSFGKRAKAVARPSAESSMGKCLLAVQADGSLDLLTPAGPLKIALSTEEMLGMAAALQHAAALERGEAPVLEDPMPEVRLEDLIRLRDMQPRLPAIFPTLHSLTWHVRTARQYYAAAGALFEIGGRLLVHPELFKRVALGLAARKSPVIE